VCGGGTAVELKKKVEKMMEREKVKRERGLSTGGNIISKI